MSENNVLPVILAGGKSRRFGGNKANAKLGDLTLSIDSQVPVLIEKIDPTSREVNVKLAI